MVNARGRKAARFLRQGIALTWAAKPKVSQSLPLEIPIFSEAGRAGYSADFVRFKVRFASRKSSLAIISADIPLDAMAAASLASIGRSTPQDRFVEDGLA